jgi:hypothetical protein
VSGFVGHTAQRTNEVIDSALGKVLFIDEAYALARPGPDGDFGPERWPSSSSGWRMTAKRLAVIIAGHPDEIEAFLATNPGFASRFGETLTFDDFSPAELAATSSAASACLPITGCAGLRARSSTGSRCGCTRGATARSRTRAQCATCSMTRSRTRPRGSAGAAATSRARS